MKAHRWDWMTVSEDRFDRGEFLGVVQEIDEGENPIDIFGWWVPVNGKTNPKVPFSQGYAMQAMIKAHRLPGVTHICCNNYPTGGHLVGVRCEFKGEQRVEVFALDLGDTLHPIANRVFEPQAREAVSV